MSTPTLTPPDLDQCQGLVLSGSFMTFGPRSWVRCKNAPAFIATEREPAADGVIGSMSLCDDCAAILQANEPGRAVLRRIGAKS